MLEDDLLEDDLLEDDLLEDDLLDDGLLVVFDLLVVDLLAEDLPDAEAPDEDLLDEDCTVSCFSAATLCSGGCVAELTTARNSTIAPTKNIVFFLPIANLHNKNPSNIFNFIICKITGFVKPFFIILGFYSHSLQKNLKSA